jgi:hypothetical protein
MAEKPKKEKREPPPYAELPPALDARKLGRPSTYDPEYCDLVIDMGTAGKSKAQMAAGLGISRQCMNEWEKQHKEFGDAVKAAQDLALAWWETAGQFNMTRQGFNATAFIFQMKNRFRADYRDTQDHEVSGKDGGPIETKETSDIETARRVAFMLGRAVGRNDKKSDVSA